MSNVTQLDSITKEELKRRIVSLTNIEDWADECSKCGYPKVLHKELHQDAACTQEPELPKILNKNWSDFRKRVNPIVKAWKDVLWKEQEEGVLLNGLERLILKISGQNTDNMNKYTENMTTLVSTLKESLVKEDGSTTKDGSCLSPSVSRVVKLIQKREKVDSHELQTLRNLVKKGGEEVIKNFEDAFKEVTIEGEKKHL